MIPRLQTEGTYRLEIFGEIRRRDGLKHELEDIEDENVERVVVLLLS